MGEHYPSFPLSLITPESVYFLGEASMVEVPGTLGDFGVLKGHAPFISTIRPGVVKIHKEGEEQKIFVTGGLAEVNPESCTILAERVEDISKMTSIEAVERLNKAKATLENTFEDESRKDAEAELKIAEAIVAALSH